MSFKKDKYQVIKGAISTELADFCYQYFLNKRAVAEGTKKGPEGPQITVRRASQPALLQVPPGTRHTRAVVRARA